MTTPELRTDRLVLRAPVRADAGDIARLANDWDVARRLARMPYPYALDDAYFFLEEIVPKAIVWGVRRAEDDALMGMMSLTPASDARAAELGYWLAREFWGKGVATEAAAAVIACGRGRFAALTSGYFEDNPKSGRVLEKLGFRETGRGGRASLAHGRELPHVDVRLDFGAP